VKILSYKDLVDNLIDIFCKYGYDGTSLTILAKNTGLGRASLYYHFPGGKEEMANAVYEKISRDFTKLVLSPLATELNFHTKIKNMLEGINAFYDNGKRSCLIDVFAIGSTKDIFDSQIKNAAIYWKESLIKIIVDEGVHKDQAEIISEDIIISIEGALIFTRATGDYESFNRTLKKISQSASNIISR
jgi:AcrR family transcriptional regulator